MEDAVARRSHPFPPLTAGHIRAGLVKLLSQLGIVDPESSLTCERAHGEWPPVFVIHPAHDVEERLSSALTNLLHRTVPDRKSGWTLDRREGGEIAGLL